MKSDYRISVLIPCHSTKFLPECIDSIQEQTLSKDCFEVVIVADRVEQAEVAEILDGRGLNFRIISSSGPGIVAALNTGLMNISSAYVARMDEDDLMYPDRLQRQIEYLEKTSNCVVVGGQLEIIDSQGTRLGEFKFRRNIGKSFKDLLATSPLAHPAVMIRNTAISKVGGYRGFLAEDWDLWVRLREIGEVHNLSQKVIKYRIHENQLSREKMYAQSRARHIVGLSYFARQRNLMDAPGISTQLETWLEESKLNLLKGNPKFRLFLYWSKRLDLYQKRLDSLLATRKPIKLFALITHHPFWFLSDMLKKILANR